MVLHRHRLNELDKKLEDDDNIPGTLIKSDDEEDEEDGNDKDSDHVHDDNFYEELEDDDDNNVPLIAPEETHTAPIIKPRNKFVRKLPKITVEGDTAYVHLLSELGFKAHLEQWVGELRVNTKQSASQIVNRSGCFLAYVDNELGGQRQSVTFLMKYVMKHHNIIGAYSHHLLNGGYKPRKSICMYYFGHN
jgi:hypothetical protein